ncbi:MAG: M48 family metalloprotease [Candidatus Moeniiplasma glomeromycotorum]|nr:M48 family metalloprotease [Candidatus Moeniiplasma glomeromycotorum]MCE8162541.1 M48 family metalloprotease [Candidatus Moeniiplasma glomeromycotorum]MCE8166533.1 M48 family metalloprotease [Candidatus Moeniiplasma glomeromycotorum]MCE8166996.1 M48 family metalloprotease [Candidatus Moeniiplasma glomeromycotorum]
MHFFWIFVIFLVGALVLAVIVGLLGYYSSKNLAKWVKGVKRIDHRRDLEQARPGGQGWKLKEIVQLVREVSQVHKIKMPEVGIYPSNEVNAFATGPANNTLIAFSTNLVNIMNPAEIKGVIGHELSHLIHNDVKRILIVQGIFDALYWTLSFLIGWFLFRTLKRDEETTVGDLLMWVFQMVLFQIITTILRLIGILIVYWYTRKRELKADLRGAEIVGIDNMLAALYKLLELENKAWIVDGIDLTEDEKTAGSGEPNSISLLKFNPEKKKRGILDWFRTHPRLEERIARLEEIKRAKGRRR